MVTQQEEVYWLRKDGRKVKRGLHDYIGVRESHGLASSAPPQQVLSVLMIDQHPGHSDSVPLKSELQRDLKNSLACNVKDAASIECLKQDNKIQQNTITLQKEKLKMLGEDRRQVHGEKRTLEKTFQTELKEVGEDRSKLKSALTEEN